MEDFENETQSFVQKSGAKVPLEDAKNEVLAWLKSRRIPEYLYENEEYVAKITKLAELVASGVMVIDADTNEITQNLIYGLGLNEQVKTLVYKPRINVSKLSNVTQKINIENPIEIQIAYIRALTGISEPIGKAMDNEDLKIARALLVFFMS